jgi:acetoacetyl-CoA synthetase
MDVFWSPTDKFKKKSQMTQFMAYVNKNHSLDCHDYTSFHAWSVKEPGKFWLELWNWCQIKCKNQPKTAFVPGEKMQDSCWMEGATLNFAENLLSRRDRKKALIFCSENGEHATLTYAQLWQQTAALAQYLRDEGVAVGDRVCAVVPNFHLTVVCMLATTSLGATWCACSPDFGVDALVTRFRQVSPLVLISVDGYHYNGKTYDNLDKTCQLQKKLSSVKSTVILPYINTDNTALENCTHYDDIMSRYDYVKDIVFEYLPFSHPVYILFSSGTTGKPKCMVHGAGGTLLQHLKEHRLHGDLKPLDRMLFYTTCGWMMWNWSVSVLAAQGTLVLFDGSPFYPKKSRLFDIIDAEKVNILGVGAKYLEVCGSRHLSPKDSHSLKSLRQILTTGSPLLPASFDYVSEHIKKDLQLCSISGGSDIISCFFLGNPLLPIYRGELQAPGLGMDMKIYNETGESLTDVQGELVCCTPFPSMPVYFWNDTDGKLYQTAYFDRFPGIWAHGDFALMRDNLSTVIYGRSDTTLNPGGVRIGTAEIYQELDRIPEINEGLAVGQSWHSDERIVLFVTLNNEHVLTHELKSKIKKAIRNNLSPKHVPAIILSVPDLPKTVNGKLVEKVVKNTINGKDPGDTSTLENPECLAAFKNRSELG